MRYVIASIALAYVVTLAPRHNTLQTGMIPVIDTKPVAAGPTGCPGTPQPVECWLMNEGAGTNMATGSLTGDNLTLTSSARWTTLAGFPGSVYSFQSGPGDHGIGANQTSTNFDGSTPFSVCGWTKNSGTGNATTMIGTLQTSNNQRGWELSWNAASQAQFIVANNTSNNWLFMLGGGTSIPTGIVAQFCATYDGSKTPAGAIIYVNGTNIGASALFNSLTGTTANTNPVRINDRDNLSQSGNGVLADIRIWNVVLTSGQISTLFGLGPQ